MFDAEIIIVEELKKLIENADVGESAGGDRVLGSGKFPMMSMFTNVRNDECNKEFEFSVKNQELTTKTVNSPQNSPQLQKSKFF